MHQTLLPVHFAGIFGLGMPELIVIGIIIAFPLFVIAIVATALFFKHRQRQMWHETARLALEKGQALPPLPSDFSHRDLPRDSKRHDLRGGIILVAVSLGIYQFFGAVAPQVRTLAAIPGFIGGALILLGILEAAAASAAAKKSASETRSPLT